MVCASNYMDINHYVDFTETQEDIFTYQLQMNWNALLFYLKVSISGFA